MPTTKHIQYETTKPGREQSFDQLPGALFLSGPIFGQESANWETSVKSKLLSYRIGGNIPYAAGRWTQTLDNSSTITEVAGTRGLRLQTQATPTDNDDVTITCALSDQVRLNKVYKAWAEVTVSSAANMGLTMGFVTSTAVDPLGTAPADGVYFAKAKNAATVVGRLIANSGTARDTGTLLTMADATIYHIGLEFMFGNGNPTDFTTAATVAGSYLNWVVGTLDTTTGNWTYTATPATSAQMTDLIAIFNTTPATLGAHIGGRVNGTTQRNIVIGGALFEVDR